MSDRAEQAANGAMQRIAAYASTLHPASNAEMALFYERVASMCTARVEGLRGQPDDPREEVDQDETDEGMSVG
jgi:hypothetical protein